MDLPTKVVMTPHQSISYPLPSVAGAGYLWQVDTTTDGPLSHPRDVVLAVIERGAAGQTPTIEGALRVGAGLPEVLRLTALAPGSVTVHLVQRRPWEATVRSQWHTKVVVETVPDPLEMSPIQPLDEPVPREETGGGEGASQVSHDVGDGRAGRQSWH